MKRCDWCQREVHAEQNSKVVDKLTLHTDKVGDSQSCEDAYRNYCRYIREGPDRPAA